VFVGSFLDNLPESSLPEVACIGRSNVGKSSLINHLLNRRIARVSKTPGKTITINLFSVKIDDEEFLLADLPGYGFAKRSKTLRESWGQSIDRYLSTRRHLKLLLVLLDIRHLPSPDDCAFLEWAHHARKPVVLILTKSDKLLPRERERQMAAVLHHLPQHEYRAVIPYSIKTSEPRKQLLKTITEVLLP
jgi:GTP-binding protein